jgi:hypothetical protein
VEAAHIVWRPLGQLLVERGMLTGTELEQALAKQQETGRRLGETIVECGFVSGPELANALAAQYGIELATESGFGTGLRSEIQRRHETERRSGERPVVPRLAVVPEQMTPAEEPEVEPEAAPLPPGGDAALLAQLEEQWAKLAAAEAALAERDRDLRQAVEVATRLRTQLEELKRSPQEDRAPEPESHLLFVQLDGRYALVSRDGPPPRASTELTLPDVDDGVFVVAGSRRSPLPGDVRPCLIARRL